MLVPARIPLQENHRGIGKVLSIRYRILLGPDLLGLVPRTLLIIGIVVEAKRRESERKRRKKMCSPPGSPGRRDCMDILPSEHTGGVFRPIPAVRKHSKHRDEHCTNFNPDWFLVM